MAYRRHVKGRKISLLHQPLQGYRLWSCSNTDLELYWFDGDEALLHRISSGTIYPLDSYGLYAWFALEEGIAPVQLVAALVGRGRSESEASRFVTHLAALRDGHEPVEAESVSQTSPAWDAVPFCYNYAEEAHFRVLDVGVHLSGVGEKLLDELTQLLAPCRLTQPFPTSLTLNVASSGKQQSVMANGYCVAQGLDTANLLPLLLDGIRRYAYLHSDFTLAFHAAAVGTERCTLLLPGGSGSGKSTLTAGMMARGWSVYSDEVAVLQGTDYHLRPLPVGIGIKSGAWQVLEKHFRTLSDYPVHQRRNGIRIRYLRVDSTRAASKEQAATHLLFPRYQQGARTAYKPLSVVDSIRHFQCSDYHMITPLGHDGVAGLIAWLSSIPRYAFTFGELESALDSLELLT